MIRLSTSKVLHKHWLANARVFNCFLPDSTLTATCMSCGSMSRSGKPQLFDPSSKMCVRSLVHCAAVGSHLRHGHQLNMLNSKLACRPWWESSSHRYLALLDRPLAPSLNLNVVLYTGTRHASNTCDSVGLAHTLLLNNNSSGSRTSSATVLHNCQLQFVSTTGQRIHHLRMFSNKPSQDEDSPTSGRTEGKMKDTVKEMKKDLVLTVPNVLTTMRMGLAPVLGYLVLQESYSMACVLFIVAGISDVLDGWIARNFENQTSAIGSFIDPLADKLLVSILCVTLTMMSLIPVPLTALIIARDVCLIVAAFYIRYISLPPPKTLARYFEITMITARLQPTLISKVNTAVQLTMLAASLAAPVFSFVDHSALQALWYMTAGTTIASGLTYVFAKDTFKIIQEAKKKSS